MTKWCVVPTCTTGRRSQKSKCSVFRVPKDIAQMEKWEASIPGIPKLKPADVVCEKHFEERYIHREWIKHDLNGRVIAQVPYKRPQLDKLAIPSKFDSVPSTESFTVQSTEVASDTKTGAGQDPIESDSSLVYSISRINDPTDSAHESIQSSDLKIEFNISANSYLMLTPIQNIDTRVDESVYMKNMAGTELPVSVNADVPPMKEAFDDPLLETAYTDSTTKVAGSDSTMEVACSDPMTEDVFTDVTIKVARSDSPVEHVETLVTCAKPYRVYSSGIIRENIKKSSLGTYEEFSSALPEPWSVAEFPVDQRQCVLFSLAVRKRKNGIDCPVTQKSVILNEDRTIQYFVYGRPIDTQNTKLDNTLYLNENISNILTKFRGINICCGLGAVNINNLLVDSVFLDYVEQWRSKNCPLVSKTKRCNSCTKMRKSALRNMARLRNRSAIDRCKLLTLQKKLIRERRQKSRAIKQVERLKYCLKTLEEEIASIKLPSLEEKLSELNIPTDQKAVLKEIITTANCKDARGRRYTKKWMRLCMLMNIRSPRYYDFLRKNQILPLPCSRTIHSYFSLNHSKCSLDETLKKHFATETPV